MKRTIEAQRRIDRSLVKIEQAQRLLDLAAQESVRSWA
jgi:hypothetical protein